MTKRFDRPRLPGTRFFADGYVGFRRRSSSASSRALRTCAASSSVSMNNARRSRPRRSRVDRGAGLRPATAPRDGQDERHQTLRHSPSRCSIASRLPKQPASTSCRPGTASSTMPRPAQSDPTRAGSAYSYNQWTIRGDTPWPKNRRLRRTNR